MYSTIKESIASARRLRASYAIMDQESENEDDEEEASHSLFYSVQQDHNGEESIPLTDSQAYSDRSQLAFNLTDDETTAEEQEQERQLRQQQHSDSHPQRPSDIYLETPSSSTQPPPSPHPPAFKSLSESILPTTASIPPGITTDAAQRKPRDPFFAAVYFLALSFFFVSGIVAVLTTDSHALESYARSTTFRAIKDSAGIIVVIILSALVAGTAWIYILRSFTKPLIWGSVFGFPCALFAVFLWSLVESRQKNDLDSGLTVMSFIPLVLGLIFTKLVHGNRDRIRKSIVVIELACDVLRFNPGILLVSLILMGVFILFTALWTLFFSRIWLMGHVVRGNVSFWVVDRYAYLLGAFYIFFYMWTAAVLLNIQRYVLSALTAQWYFYRQDPTSIHRDMAWRTALRNASTTSLGTNALGGLILSLVQIVQVLIRYSKRHLKRSWPLVPVIFFIVGYLEGLVSQINHYTITLAGITGESFCSSATSGTKMFRRNLLSGLLGDLLTKLILYVGPIVIALFSGFGGYIFATHTLQSSHGFIVGLLTTLMPLYLSQFYSYVMMSIVDATFLCYAIDLDTGTVHLSTAHTVFSDFE
ncbi:plasma-membrane choline transporter-domain-containing protein [Syncephalastrum racemosum]|uniref:Protein PNS1 n=1 Tax=Syncephalastrum racemosum TaxID=13706 RepID=A0A1X2HC94_SYNRA|nr:plasma-membrane choline transporter-domain-containing protein [Syncephalastrum racemosum]